MWSYNYTYSNELYHHGVKGMKWGVRRRKPMNADSPASRKKISKKYKKQINAAASDLRKNYTKVYSKAYNKAADKMNSGGIDRFNAEQKKKYGDNYSKRSGYEDDYNKMFTAELQKSLNKTVSEFYDSNRNYKKATALVDQYGMTKWDDLAKNNQKEINMARKSFE